MVVVLPADVGGVREERLRAALIRTFTVDGILNKYSLLILLLSKRCPLSLLVQLSSIDLS